MGVIVRLRYNELWGNDWAEVTWPEDTELTITIGNSDYTKTVYVGENGAFYDWPEYEIEDGDLITVTDGTTTMIHQVEYLNITAVDFDNNIVSGEATSHKEVQVIWYDPAGDYHDNETIISDANGKWEVDLTGIYDIGPENQVHARINDNQGNSTLDHWWQRQGRIGANPVRNILYAYDWTPHEQVEITITGGDGHNRTVQANRYGNYKLELDGIFDIQAGYEITATQGTVTATYTVSPLTVTEVDHNANTVSGTTGPGSDLVVLTSAFEMHNIEADSQGNWSVEVRNLWPESTGWAFEYGGRRNFTCLYWPADILD